MKTSFVVIVLLIAHGGSLGQIRSLSVEEATRLGLENSKVLRISQARVEGAQAKSSETDAARLPSLKVTAGYTRLSDVEPFRVNVPISPTPITISPIVLDNYSTRVSLRQPLFTGFRLHGLAQSADYSLAATRSDHELERVESIYAVKYRYWTLYYAIEEKKVVDENVEMVKSHLADVENFLRKGLATKNDVLKVQVQLSSAHLKQLEARNAVELARTSLNILIGLPMETELSPSSAVTQDPKSAAPRSHLIAEALSHRSDLRALDSRVKAADALVTAAKGSWFPQIDLVGNYYYSRPNPRILPTSDRFRDTWDIGINLQWDLWNSGSSVAQVQQAEAQYRQTTTAYEQLKDVVELEVTQYYLVLQQAREMISVAEEGKTHAEENYRVTRERFRQGVATNSDLLDAEVALLQAKTNYTRALVEFELAQARLEKSIGTS